MMGRKVYLVPGFFGFTRMGAFNYFEGVSEALETALAHRDLKAEIVECRTQPTASIRRRADRLAETVRETGGLDAEEIHFVGHSTGGLDVRLLTTPGVRLRPGGLEERIAERTRSVVTVATPHYGTPLAGFFTTLPGRQALEVLALLATSSGGRLGAFAAAQMLAFAARADDLLGRDRTFLDYIARRLLWRVSHRSDDPLWTYLQEIASDQGLVLQLTPECMHLFNAAVTDSPSVRYASVLTTAPPPPLHYRPTELLSVVRTTLAGAFTLLYALTAREHRHYRYPHPGRRVLSRLEKQLPFALTPASNDGVVPTMSQVYGRILDVVVADHLDVVGQYRKKENPHSDWLPSGSGFDRGRFSAIWDRVAEEISVASDESSATVVS